MKYVAICSVAVVIGMFTYLAAESKMLSYMSSDPKACVNCHAMNTHYATWQHNIHREEATCVDCHLPHDSFANKMVAKAIDGFNHSVAMTLGDYGANLRVTTNAAQRIQDNCISCHELAVSRMLESAKLYSKEEGDVQMGRRCWECHRDVPHGRTRNLLTTYNNLGVKEL